MSTNTLNQKISDAKTRLSRLQKDLNIVTKYKDDEYLGRKPKYQKSVDAKQKRIDQYTAMIYDLSNRIVSEEHIINIYTRMSKIVPLTAERKIDTPGTRIPIIAQTPASMQTPTRIDYVPNPIRAFRVEPSQRIHRGRAIQSDITKQRAETRYALGLGQQVLLSRRQLWEHPAQRSEIMKIRGFQYVRGLEDNYAQQLGTLRDISRRLNNDALDNFETNLTHLITNVRQNICAKESLDDKIAAFNRRFCMRYSEGILIPNVFLEENLMLSGPEIVRILENMMQHNQHENGENFYLRVRIDYDHPFNGRSDKYLIVTPTSLPKLRNKLTRLRTTNTSIQYGSDRVEEMFAVPVISLSIALEHRVGHEGDLEGGFFSYYNKTKIDLTKYMIYTRDQFMYSTYKSSWTVDEMFNAVMKQHEEEYKSNKNKPRTMKEVEQLLDRTSTICSKVHKPIPELLAKYNCFTYALLQWGVDEKTLDDMKSYMTGRYIKTCEIRKLCEIYNIAIEVTKMYDFKTGKKNKQTLYGDAKLAKINLIPTYHLGLFKRHFFINDEANFHDCLVKQYQAFMEYGNLNRMNEVTKIVERVNKDKTDTKFTFEYNNKLPHKNIINLLYLMFEYDRFKPMPYEDCDLVGEKPEDEHINLDKIIRESAYKLVEEYKEKEFLNETIKFADTEASALKGTTHKEYCICCRTYDANIKSHFTKDPKTGEMKRNNKAPLETLTMYNNDCAKIFLKQNVKNGDLLFYHNLKYDFRFLFKQLQKVKALERSGSLYQVKANFGGKSMTIRDTLKLINNKLSEFTKMFDLESFKEIYPYDFYSPENLFRFNYTINDVATKYIVGESPTKKMANEKVFKDNCAKLGMIGLFDPQLYCEYYCGKDVEVMAEGYMKFLIGIEEITGIDIRNMLTISSLADNYMKKEGCYNGVYTITGKLRKFIQKCVCGGRVMSTKMIKKEVVDIINQKGYEHKPVKSLQKEKSHMMRMDKCNLSLYDFCSLYPSAICALVLQGMGFSLGPPRLINSEAQFKQIVIDELQKEKDLNECTKCLNKCIELKDEEWIKIYTESKKQLLAESLRCGKYYYVEIHINKIGKFRQFPLINQIDEDGSRNFSNECFEREFVDRIGLEDIMQFHEVKIEDIEFIQGIYFEGFNPKCQEVIEHLYSTRKKYKKAGNKLEAIVKLILNSIYGKTIIKEQSSEKKYFDTKEEFDEYHTKHFTEIDTYDIIQGKYRIKLNKSVLIHRNRAQIGCQILSMSKRLMNRVICLAEDLNIPIYYQDTDSTHIDSEYLEILKKAYKEMYGTDLDGGWLGQMHNDFEIAPNVINVKADRAIFLAKKCYYNHLYGEEVEMEIDTSYKGTPDSNTWDGYKIKMDKKGNPIPTGKIVYSHRIKMKGVSKEAILKLAKEKYGQYENPIYEIYNDLYEGATLEFDLAALDEYGKVSFDFGNDMTIKTNNSFIRKMNFSTTNSRWIS